MLCIILLSYCQFVSVVDVHTEHCQTNCCEPKALNTQCLFALGSWRSNCIDFEGQPITDKLSYKEEGLKEGQGMN